MEERGQEERTDVPAPSLQIPNVFQVWASRDGLNPNTQNPRFSKWFNSMSHFWKKKIHTMVLVLA